jgi:hypothetical protein
MIDHLAGGSRECGVARPVGKRRLARGPVRSAADPDVLVPVGMHNHASSRAIRVGTAVLTVGPELCSRDGERS